MADTAPLAHTDVLVLDYLAALWAETEDLTPELRDELMTTVADYVARRRAAGGEHPERIIRRLGPPEDLAAAVRRGRMPPHLRLPALMPVAAPGPAAGTTDYVAIVLLIVGAVFLPLVAPLAGMALVSGSPRWTPAQKAAAWVLAATPSLCGMLLLFGGMLLAAEVGPVVLLAYLAMVAGPFVAGLTLLPGLSARPQAA